MRLASLCMVLLLLAGASTLAAAPPVGVRAHVPDGVEPAPLFGVEVDKLKAPAVPRYTLNGVPVTRTRVIEAIEPVPEPVGAPPLPDPRGKLQVTVIGSDAERADVVRDLTTSPALAWLRPRLVVREYRPDHWHVAEVGFKLDGKPTIYAQTDDGLVRHRQDTYRGPQALASALRKADPAYDPKLDPDANASPLSWEGLRDLAGKVPPLVWVGVAVAAFLVFRKDK